MKETASLFTGVHCLGGITWEGIINPLDVGGFSHSCFAFVFCLHH